MGGLQCAFQSDDELWGAQLRDTARLQPWRTRSRCATQKIVVDGRDVVPDVWDVLDRIKDFSDKVRNGEWLGVTGKPLRSVVAVGIGGSFLGPLFVHTALK